MAFHHQNTHYYHHHHQQPLHHQQQNNNPACHCGCSSQPPSHHPSSSPFSHSNPPTSDPLLIQSIVTQILQSSPPPPSSHHPSPSPQCSPPYSIDPLLIQSIVTQILQSSQPPPPPPPENHLYPKFLKPQKQQQKQTENQEEKRTRSLLKNLHCRIDALESSLHHLSTSSSSSPSSHSHHNLPSLRDLAARIIQIHFRAFLVRRSRTLRYLKNLGFIKSSFNSLKSSLSTNNNNSQLNHSVLSQKAMDLLLKLDSVQGGDPMIRDGKRSISRDLVRFLEFIDSISVKRQQISSKTMKNVRTQTENNQEFRVCRDQGGSQKVLDKLNQRIQDCYRVIDDENDTDEEEEEEEEHGEIEDLHPIDDEQENSRDPNYGILVKRPNVSVKSKKSVRFADNEGNVFIGSRGSQDSNSDIISIGGGNDQRQFVQNLSRNAEEIIGGFSSKISKDDNDEGASQSSNASEGSPREYVKTEVTSNIGSNKQFSNENGNFLFSPPMPVTMEPKIDDLMNRRSNYQRFVR
ncbi:hypothetical protein MKX01_028369 [Papaver californicum]|nr:hypothetical protein MKX01_028369 [Papaver californicum]